MSLYDQFNGVQRDYYIEKENNFKNDFSVSKEALIEFFKLGNKEAVLGCFDEFDEYRAKHSMSLLYFGILLNKEMNFNMSVSVSDQIFKFNYFWSILCFYHDLGYEAEKTNSFIFKMKKRRWINRNFRCGFFCSNMICRDFSLKFKYVQHFSKSIDLFSHLDISHETMIRNRGFFNENDYNRIDNIKDIKVNYFNKSIVLTKSFFRENEIINYYKYRLDEFGVYDHGIVGGYIFFDSIIKSYIDSYYTNQQEDSIVEFYRDYRRYCIEQIPLFAYLSDCIVSHNVFFPTKDNEKLYDDYSMISLNRRKKISIDDNPLLFLLDLIDTIDPIKFFSSNEKKLTIDQILKSFNWKIKKFNIEICLINEELISLNKYIQYTNRILGASEWLNVEITFINNIINIKIIDGKEKYCKYEW